MKVSDRGIIIGRLLIGPKNCITDAPLSSRQLKRVIKRCGIGLERE